MSILWGGKKWRPSSPVRRQPINQSIEELMKPLGEKTFKGNVWGSVIMKVPEATEPQPEPTPTPTPTPSPQPVLWVAANGQGFTEGYSTSVNGNIWSAATVNIPFTGSGIYSIASDGTKWVGAGEYYNGSTYPAISYYSNDGRDWYSGDTLSDNFTTSNRIATNGSIWLIGGTSSGSLPYLSGYTSLSYSYDGISFSAASVTTTGTTPTAVSSFAYDGIKWLATSSATGTTSTATRILTSYDGKSWTGQTNTLFASNPTQVAYGNGKWVVAVGGTGAGKLIASTDGVSWTASTNANDSTIFGANSVNQLRFFDGKFVATTSSASGATTHIINYSYDGLIWSACTDTKLLINRGITNLSFNDTLMIAQSSTAAGTGATTSYISTNGINWSANTPTNINQVFTSAQSVWAASNVQVLPLPNTPTPTPSSTATPTPTPSSTATPTPTPTLTTTPTPTSTPVFTTEYQAILNYATTNSYPLPSSSQKVLQNQMIVDLKAAGIWDKLDLFYVFANDGSQSFATLNWKNPSSTYQIGFVNGPLYYTNLGLQGDNTDAYLTTGWRPTFGVNYQQNNASRFAWVFTGASDNSKAIDITADGTNVTSYSNSVDLRINSGVNNLSSAFDFTGNNMLKFISRTGSNTVYLRNGSTTGTRNALSAARVASDLTLLGRAAGNASATGISIYGVGDSLTTLDDDLNTILSTYMTSI